MPSTALFNIITKPPEEMKGTTLQFGGGELGTLTASAINAGQADKFGYRLSLGWNQNQQWRNRAALAFRDYLLNAHTEYALSNDAKLKLSGGVVDSNRFDGPLHTAGAVSSLAPAQAYTAIAYERSNAFFRAWWMETNSSNPSSASLSQLGNLVRFGLDRNFNAEGKLRGNTFNVEAQHAVHLGTTDRLTYGFNYRHNTFSERIIDQFSREDRLGIYVQNEWRVVDPLTVVAGARYDLDTLINPTLSPRFALLYQPIEGHTIRVAVSVGYRPPTLIDEHLDVRTVIMLPSPFPSPPPTATTGSPNLKPEQITSYEIGYQGWFYKHRLLIRTDLFFNHISDLIQFRNATTPSNSGEADIYGGEAGFEFLAARWLSGFANGSYQEFGQTFTGDVRRAAPRFKWNAGLRGEWDNGLNAEVAYHYYGAVTYPIGQAFFAFAPFGVIPPNARVGSYNLLNLRAGWRFWEQKAAAGYFREAEVAVSAFNALNDRHKEHPLGDTIGSRVMGWLTVKF